MEKKEETKVIEVLKKWVSDENDNKFYGVYRLDDYLSLHSSTGSRERDDYNRLKKINDDIERLFTDLKDSHKRIYKYYQDKKIQVLFSFPPYDDTFIKKTNALHKIFSSNPKNDDITLDRIENLFASIFIETMGVSEEELIPLKPKGNPSLKKGEVIEIIYYDLQHWKYRLSKDGYEEYDIVFYKNETKKSKMYRHLVNLMALFKKEKTGDSDNLNDHYADSEYDTISRVFPERTGEWMDNDHRLKKMLIECIDKYKIPGKLYKWNRVKKQYQLLRIIFVDGNNRMRKQKEKDDVNQQTEMEYGDKEAAQNYK